MGGWLSIVGDVPDFNTRLSKFKKIFSVEGVPSLRVEVDENTLGIKIIAWAWNNHFVPDVYVKKRDNHVLVLCGVVTDLGEFGPPLSTQDETALRVLQLWIEHGEKIIEQINGSFSCLLSDQKEKRISLFTDRFASRSVWTTEEDNVWIIGNFPSAIAIMKKHLPKIEPAGLWSLFHAGRHVGTHGLYSNVRALLAGQKAIISSNSKPVISQWRERRYQPEDKLSPIEWGHALADALKNSANRYKRVCENPYLFLSGGLDSRIAAAAYGKPLKTLTLCTSPNFESQMAAAVSKIIGLEHQTIIRSPYWYLDTMNAASLISSGNYLNHHTHFIVPVKDISSKDKEAEILLGDLLENFNKHYFPINIEQQLNFIPDNIENILYSFDSYTIKNVKHVGIYFNENIRKSIEARYITALKEYAYSIMKVSENHADRFDTYFRWADVSITPTYNMITCIWPLAMERNLYFDNDLNDLSLKIPSKIRGAGILHIHTLRHLNKKLMFIPDANTFLPPITPKKLKNIAKTIRPILGNLRRSIIRKRKGEEPVLKTSGSWLLLHEMYRKDLKYKQRIESIFTDKSIFPSEIFDLQQIGKTWEEYLRGNINLNFEVEALLSFGSLQKLITFNDIALL